MEFKGTGKEWESVEINIKDLRQLTIICKDTKQVIAHIYLPDYEITEELNANKQLISCAPEMLEMLKELLSCADKIFNDGEPTESYFQLMNKNELLILKATTI